MLRLHPHLRFPVILLVISCTTASEPEQKHLIGQWTTAPRDLSPTGWYQHEIGFAESGAIAIEMRSYGMYAGQPRDELSSYTRTEGTFQTEGERLIVQPQRLVWWDRFYGAASPERVEELYPDSRTLDEATFVLRDDKLTLHYLSYPADAPVATSMELTRTR